VLAAAALARLLAREPLAGAGAMDPWDIPDGWRVSGHAWTKFRFSTGPAHSAVEVRVRGLVSADAEIAVGDGDPVPARAEFREAGRTARGPGAGPAAAGVPGAGPPVAGLVGAGVPVAGLPGAGLLGAGLLGAGQPGAAPGGTDLIVTYGGRVMRFAYATDCGTIWLGRDGQAWTLTEEEAAPARAGLAGGADGTVRSPMPGTVLAVHVGLGERVSAGQAVAVVEAMKMEHTVTAPLAGTVTELTAKPGQQVGMDASLAVIGPGAAE